MTTDVETVRYALKTMPDEYHAALDRILARIEHLETVLHKAQAGWDKCESSRADLLAALESEKQAAISERATANAALVRIQDLVSERADLLAALERAERWVGVGPGGPDGQKAMRAVREYVRAAIAAAHQASSGEDKAGEGRGPQPKRSPDGIISDLLAALGRIAYRAKDLSEAEDIAIAAIAAAHQGEEG